MFCSHKKTYSSKCHSSNVTHQLIWKKSLEIWTSSKPNFEPIFLTTIHKTIIRKNIWQNQKNVIFWKTFLKYREILISVVEAQIFAKAFVYRANMTNLGSGTWYWQCSSLRLYVTCLINIQKWGKATVEWKRMADPASWVVWFAHVIIFYSLRYSPFMCARADILQGR